MLLNPLSHLSVSVRACGSGGALRAGVFGELAASVSLGFQPGKVGGHYRRGWADAEVILLVNVQIRTTALSCCFLVEP